MYVCMYMVDTKKLAHMYVSQSCAIIMLKVKCNHTCK